MRHGKTVLVIGAIFLLVAGTVCAEEAAWFKCLVKPPQAGTWPFLGQWNVVVEWRYIVGGMGFLETKRIVAGPDGFFEFTFPRPRAAGIRLTATIRVVGGWAYKDSWVTINWEGGQPRPDVFAGFGAEIVNVVRPPHTDTVLFGVTFHIFHM
jgi:hypothetical protein